MRIRVQTATGFQFFGSLPHLLDRSIPGDYDEHPAGERDSAIKIQEYKGEGESLCINFGPEAEKEE